jgi:DNA primase
VSVNRLTREQIIDLLEYVGAEHIINNESKNWIMFCCPVHGENHPSAGVNVEEQYFNCFSCHASGDFGWLLTLSLPDDFPNVVKAYEFLKKRYGFNYIWDSGDSIKRYEDKYDEEEKEQRKVLPNSYLAAFRSGKETYKYFFNRGFTKKTMKEFMIGRDIFSKTVTIPVYYEDGKLAGCIGRYITKRRKNERYKIYEVKTGDILFPIDKIDTNKNTLILCEGILDALWLHQLGYKNSGALLTNNVSVNQSKWIKDHFDKVVDMTDNDEMGLFASKSIQKRLSGLSIYGVTYPEGKKDPQDCSKEEIENMLENKEFIIKMHLKVYH